MVKVGAILAIIGGILMIIAGFILIYVFHSGSRGLSDIIHTLPDHILEQELSHYQTTYSITFMLTVLWGILGFIGGILVIREKKIGNYICLFVGAIATLGMFITINQGTFELGAPYQPISYLVPMNGTFIFIDPILILLGGIIGIATKDK